MAAGNISQQLKFEDLPDYKSVVNKLNKRKYPKHLIMVMGLVWPMTIKYFHTMLFMIL